MQSQGYQQLREVHLPTGGLLLGTVRGSRAGGSPNHLWAAPVAPAPRLNQHYLSDTRLGVSIKALGEVTKDLALEVPNLKLALR